MTDPTSALMDLGGGLTAAEHFDTSLASVGMGEARSSLADADASGLAALLPVQLGPAFQEAAPLSSTPQQLHYPYDPDGFIAAASKAVRRQPG